MSYTICKATTKSGAPCRSFAITEDGLCRTHSLTPEQRTEEARHRQALQARSRRLKNDPHHDLREFMTDKMLHLVCAALQSDNLSEQFAGVYTTALVTGLFETPMTAAEFRAAMNERLPEDLRDKVRPLPTAWETRRMARRAWYEGHRRYSPVVGFYIQRLPEHLLEEGKTAEQLIAEEAPDLVAAQVREVNGEASVVQAVSTDGTVTLVPQDRPEPPAHYAKAHRLASIALARREELSAA